MPTASWRSRAPPQARGTLQCLSTMTSTPIEDVNKALGRPVWYQLYAPSKWAACEQLLRRVEAAGTHGRRC